MALWEQAPEEGLEREWVSTPKPDSAEGREPPAVLWDARQPPLALTKDSEPFLVSAVTSPRFERSSGPSPGSPSCPSSKSDAPSFGDGLLKRYHAKWLASPGPNEQRVDPSVAITVPAWVGSV